MMNNMVECKDQIGRLESQLSNNFEDVKIVQVKYAEVYNKLIEQEQVNQELNQLCAEKDKTIQRIYKCMQTVNMDQLSGLNTEKNSFAINIPTSQLSSHMNSILGSPEKNSGQGDDVSAAKALLFTECKISKLNKNDNALQELMNSVGIKESNKSIPLSLNQIKEIDANMIKYENMIRS